MRRIFPMGLVIAALVLGLLLAWVDSRPTWDDTGLMVGVLALTCAGFGAAHPKRAWLWALLIGGWIPLFGVLVTHNYGSLIALGVACIGAYVGVLVRTVARYGQTTMHT